MKPPAWLVVVLVGALAGLVFAGISTYDFVQHLDRQVHSLHCSFIPGASAEAGASGCQVAMMSPYSSVFRTAVWGGIPISLPAMAVFAFLLFYGLDLLVGRRTTDTRATGFLALATALPAAASITMGTISLVKLGTTCKLCVGVYLASALCVVGAIALWRKAVRGRDAGDSAALSAQVETPPVTTGYLAGMFGLGVGFVGLPLAVYFAMAPDHGKYIGSCGELAQPADTYGVMVPVQRGGETPALEILDPLCPACRAFEQRLAASGLAERLDRKAIMFPLDTSCNWMITESTHPGACTVSEAVLCAGERAPEVIAWAFEVQERIRTEAKTDPGAAARIVAQRFPELASCVGSPDAKSRLNKSLRWAVANNLHVLTPQLFINNVKLCDEDVDLGLDYALSRMIDGDFTPRPQVAKPVEAAPPPPPPEPAKPAAPAKPATEDKPAPTAAADKPATEATSAPADKPATEDKPAPPAPADKPAELGPAKPAVEDKPAEPAPAADKPPRDPPAPAEPSPAPGPVTTPGGAP